MSGNLPCPFSDTRQSELHAIWQAEGWNIFLADGSIQNENGRRPYQLQKIDEDSPFEDDHAAWDHVIAQAWTGSASHLDAMTFLKDCSPDEFGELILRIPADQSQTPGRRAYEEDVRRKPLHHDHSPRQEWEHLGDEVKRNWESNPFPRIW